MFVFGSRNWRIWAAEGMVPVLALVSGEEEMVSLLGDERVDESDVV